MRFCDFYESDNFKSEVIFLIATLIVSLILCCIYDYIFNNNAIMIITKDCEDLNILCLKSFSIVLKLN